MKVIFRIALILTNVLVGLVFIYSGYTKLYPIIETFEFTFVESGLANWYTAPIAARFMIALEFFTGVLLISQFRLKNFTIPLAAFLLLFFIVYLLIQIAVRGNTGNCACFGEHLVMSPLQAILKNLVMLAMLSPAYFFYEGWNTRFKNLIIALLGLSCAFLPFVLNPVDYTYTSNNLSEKVNYPLELDLLYHPENPSKVEIPGLELRKGKHVLAFLSLTCRHCRIAAKKFRLIKEARPELSIYFILNGEREMYSKFIEDTRADNIPYSFCLGKTFVQLASAQLPRIYYIDNSVVVKKVDYYELNQYDLEKWMGIGQ